MQICAGLWKCEIQLTWHLLDMRYLHCILKIPFQNSSVKLVSWVGGEIGTTQRHSAIPSTRSVLGYYMRVLLYSTVHFSSRQEKDKRNQRNKSKQWDNIDQEEENIVSGMLATTATTSLLGQNTILKIKWDSLIALSEKLLCIGGDNTREVLHWICEKLRKQMWKSRVSEVQE